LEFARVLRQELDQYNIVLLDSAWTAYGVISGYECKRANIPYLIYAHGAFSSISLQKSWFKKKVWWRIFDKTLYAKADAVIALTDAETRDIQTMGVSTPVMQIPNGVDVGIFSRPEPGDILEKQYPQIIGRRIILFLGRLGPGKGLNLLIPAFKQVNIRFPDTILVLVGPGDKGYERFVKKLIHKHKLENASLLTGLVIGTKKVNWLHSTDVFVLPSYGEGFSMSTLEAMASGVPVVITQTCNFPEVEKHNAGIITDTEVNSIAEGICQILHDRSAAFQMGQNGKNLVATQFSWQDISRETATFSQKIIKKHNIRIQQW
jgi:glycosyltransferase involved in cell wall biosynthesis